MEVHHTSARDTQAPETDSHCRHCPLTSHTHSRPSILVYIHAGRYVARLTSPDARDVPGDHTLPTAFDADADPCIVLQNVARDNPEADVALGPPSGASHLDAHVAVVRRRKTG